MSPAFKGDSEILTQVGELTLHWRKQADGSVLVNTEDHNDSLNAHRMFWFAWYSFNTDTKIHDVKLLESAQDDQATP